jgi:outer membrane receptor protein involved in Fe transport
MTIEPKPPTRRFAGGSLSLALLATTVLVPPAMALAADEAGAPAQVSEVIVTAEKRSQNIQNVAVSIEALDTKTLAQHQVNNFEDFVKLTPAVNFQTYGPSQTSVYMRGISSGGVENGVGPLPSVGTYLDEEPITTVAGTLDVHIYDIARIEVLPGPQGTLYGASSEAGTLRIITNEPSTGGFSAGYDLEGNTVDHGSQGYVVQGFVNIPINSRAAVRLVAFDEHDAGFIDNVYGTRYFPTSGGEINNAGYVKNDFNPVDTHGGRIALKIDLNDNWTVTPSVLAQDERNKGIFGYQPDVGFLETQRFQPDARHDRFILGALTINGHIGDYELVYSGSIFQRLTDLQADYTDYSVFYDTLYGLGAYWPGANGQPLKNPSEEIRLTDNYGKSSNEIRLLSPVNKKLKFVVGLFQERQTHYYNDEFDIVDFPTSLSVVNFPTSIYAANQIRVDRDSAVFGQATYDITSHLELTGGIRGYQYRNTLSGFFGYSEAYDVFAGYSSGPGPNNANCIQFTTYHQMNCINLDATVSATGETHKVNLTYKFDSDKLVYATYSTGYRPGGVNQIGTYGEYQADTLTNYEAGWKTSWLEKTIVWNGAVYYEDWNKFQFSFPGPNGITVTENAPEAHVTGLETNVDWVYGSHLSLSAGMVYSHARLTANFCGLDPTTGLLIPTCADSAALALKGTPLPYTPDIKADLTGRYKFDFMGWTSHAQATLAYRDATPVGLRIVEVQGLGNLPTSTTLDLALGGEKNRLSVEVFAKNVTDDHGELDRHSACSAVCYSIIPGIPSAVYHYPIQPLTVGIRVGQRF